MRNSIRRALQELLIGLGLTSPDGGGWVGIDIGYSVGGTAKTLKLDREALICGTVIEDRCRK